jgi:phosphatidylserine/phosphatidylglycerophosphate/cardiolipin synthase-like enzyme
MARVELEFEALWSDGRASLAPDEAQAHYDAMLEEFRADPTLAPSAVVGLAEGRGEPLAALDRAFLPSSREAGVVAIAFSSRGPDPAARRGAAAANRAQRFVLRTAFGTAKPMPLSLTHLALDTIFRAAPGDTLKIAMYGLSPRVAEYGALVDAARRGIRLFVLLDRAVGFGAVARLAEARASKALPIEVRTAGRMMHNKYIVHVESATVLTGTANLSTDATGRHFEHRLRVCGRRDFAQRFEAYFDAVWSRLRPEPAFAPQAAP